MTYAGLFGQPIKGALMLFQQLVNSDSDHCNPQPPAAYALFIIAVKYMSTEYIAFLTYMPACYSLPLQIEFQQILSSISRHGPDYLKVKSSDEHYVRNATRQRRLVRTGAARRSSRADFFKQPRSYAGPRVQRRAAGF